VECRGVDDVIVPPEAHCTPVGDLVHVRHHYPIRRLGVTQSPENPPAVVILTPPSILGVRGVVIHHHVAYLVRPTSIPLLVVLIKRWFRGSLVGHRGFHHHKMVNHRVEIVHPTLEDL